MDLLTLVTVCSIGFEPQVMQALVLAEGEGKPFSYRSTDGKLHSFATMESAISEARRSQKKDPTVRIGLTGLETDLFGATAEPNARLFEPCPNVALASLRLQKLRARCAEQKRYHGHETWCAIGLWHGTWQHMNVALADRVVTSIAVGDLANPELPTDCKCPAIASVERGCDVQSIRSRASISSEKQRHPAYDSGPIFVTRGGQSGGNSNASNGSLFVPLAGGRNQP
ncbi:MAG: hypothetical protein ABL996_10015 [Micropepsaceae bacterium]